MGGSKEKLIFLGLSLIHLLLEQVLGAPLVKIFHFTISGTKPETIRGAVAETMPNRAFKHEVYMTFGM